MFFAWTIQSITIRINTCNLLQILNKFKNILFNTCILAVIISVTERSKAWVCGRSPAGIAGLNPAAGVYVCLS
jgi:hypothetical protein